MLMNTPKVKKITLRGTEQPSPRSQDNLYSHVYPDIRFKVGYGTQP